MKLAVKKEAAQNGSGFHYMMFPNKMECPEIHTQSWCFELMGYIIIEVDDAKGEELLQSARKALGHQCEIAVLAEKAVASGRL